MCGYPCSMCSNVLVRSLGYGNSRLETNFTSITTRGFAGTNTLLMRRSARTPRKPDAFVPSPAGKGGDFQSGGIPRGLLTSPEAASTRASSRRRSRSPAPRAPRGGKKTPPREPVPPRSARERRAPAQPASPSLTPSPLPSPVSDAATSGDAARSRAGFLLCVGAMTVVSVYVIARLSPLDATETKTRVTSTALARVWSYGWITAVSTGLGAVPFVFVKQIRDWWLGISNGALGGLWWSWSEGGRERGVYVRALRRMWHGEVGGSSCAQCPGARRVL